MTCPSWAIASGRASFLVRLFTEEYVTPLWRSVNDRSRIQRNGFDLCGIMATGDTFSFVGMSFFISPQRTTRA